MAKRLISNSDDVVDNRDIIARLRELEDERDAIFSAIEDGEAPAEDLTASEWKDGATLIRESYFAEYAQELMQDIGALPKDIPGLVIDWEATAENLLVD